VFAPTKVSDRASLRILLTRKRSERMRCARAGRGRGLAMKLRALEAPRRAAGAAAAQAAAIDRGYLARFTMGNEALAQEVLELFAAQAPVTLDRLRRARSDADWQQAAHTLKGSAAAVGARQLQRWAELAERVTSLPDAEREAQRALALSLIGEAMEAACRQIGQMYAP
jgi:HPt (histidine-containing phosphotransfer) domain-containing protein